MKLTEDQKKLIVDLRLSGVQRKEIALRLGCTFEQVRHCLNDPKAQNLLRVRRFAFAHEKAKEALEHEKIMAHKEIERKAYPPFGKDRKLEW